jgi:hypothetical protein
VQREVRKVVRWFVRAEGGRRPRMAVTARSSAMAAMAMACSDGRALLRQGEAGDGAVVQQGEAEVVLCLTWPVTDAAVRTGGVDTSA